MPSIPKPSAEASRLAGPEASAADGPKDAAVDANLESAACGPRHITREADPDAFTRTIDQHEPGAVVLG